jgi:hypothetical protein
MKKRQIVVLGMMGRSPFGGQTWLYLNWLSGLHRLGHDVWYVEDDSVWPYDPIKDSITDDCHYAVNHISNCMQRIGLKNKWAFRLVGRKGACWGLSEQQLDDLYSSCNVLLNIVGATYLREEHIRAPLRVYVETDPVTSELILFNGDINNRVDFASHHKIFTYGENYGASDCGVPLCGIEFGKTRQPIDLDLWPMAFDPHARDFTTIGNWKQEGSDIEYAGQIYYWSKHIEWLKFIDLPQLTTQPFKVALKVDDKKDYKLLEMHGWRITSPISMSLDVFGSYPEFIRRSRAEWTVAKDQNVRLRSGWFSERDACYLASGKPVIAQDTGFSNILPTGEGLFAFQNMEEILEAIKEINDDYSRHCEAARKIAENYFDAKKVVAKLLKEIGL